MASVRVRTDDNMHADVHQNMDPYSGSTMCIEFTERRYIDPAIISFAGDVHGMLTTARVSKAKMNSARPAK